MARKPWGKWKGKAAAAGFSRGGINEETELRFTKALEEFNASDAQVYTFEPGMSSYQRGLIHNMCRKFGLKSKSAGTGNNRRISVFKTKQNNKKPEDSIHLELSEETRHILQELFTHYPPDDADLNDGVVRKSEKAKNIIWNDSAFDKPAMCKPDIEKKIQMFISKMNGSPQFRKIVENRSKLPISSFRDVISSTLENHQVVLLAGETGCGKTTQVPQYILDHMWGKGESCKIICTQPRRISAISVAERISSERGESVGDTVGYKIRLESKGGKNSSIMFCTNGLFLRLLIARGTNSTSNKQYLKHNCVDPLLGITHIIVVMPRTELSKLYWIHML